MNLLLAWGLVVGLAVVALYGLGRLPGWLWTESHWPEQAGLREAVVSLTTGLAMLLEVVCWLVLVCALLLAPIVVVEECSFVTALARWAGHLRQHLNRTLLYEALAVVPAVLVTLGLLLPIEAATRHQTEQLRAAAARAGDSADADGLVHRVQTNWIGPTRRLVHGLARRRWPRSSRWRTCSSTSTCTSRNPDAGEHLATRVSDASQKRLACPRRFCEASLTAARGAGKSQAAGELLTPSR